ncbi:type II secretion system F family protein [Candidatus Bathyarchaeota archaeon]|nr:type II secretion system F family protein [Candidatus Bathyarchaeota archaeon]
MKDFTLTGFSYRHFWRLGSFASKVFKSIFHANIEDSLEAADLRIYPEAYASMVGFLTLLLGIVGSAVTILLAWFLAPWLLVLPGILITVGIIIAIPFLTLFLGASIPKILAFNRGSNLDAEIPYASAYMSIMATGGLSPFASLQRLKNFPLLPNIAKVAKKMDIDVKALGMDPVTAMEKSAEKLPSRDYRDLMSSYASTLRGGGDVLHYLLVRTETLFRDQAAKLRAFGERTSMLMEVYIAIVVLLALSLYTMYASSIAFESAFAFALFGKESFILFAWILIPAISIAFLYLSDISQQHYPVSEWRPYKVFAAFLPLMGFLFATLALPFLVADLQYQPFFKPFAGFVTAIRSALGLERGYEATIGISIALLSCAIPGTIAHYYFFAKSKGLEEDITNFLRDLVEVRKTGLSPEKCIVNLCSRSYGRLTRYLSIVSNQLRWGMPFRTIYTSFAEHVRSWLALVNMYLLVDAIEVGGGSPETLETVAEFSEMISSQEKERRAMLRPMMVIPYIGAGILLISTIVFLGFMRSIMGMFRRYGSAVLPFAEFATLFLPPLVIQSFLMGLVTGKMSAGSISAGFKHAAVLTVFSLVVTWIAPFITIPITLAGV